MGKHALHGRVAIDAASNSMQRTSKSLGQRLHFTDK